MAENHEGQNEEISEVLSADVAMVVDAGNDQYDVMLIRRGGETEHGKLAFPGGRKSAKDKGRILATAVREAFEETRLVIREEDLTPLVILDGEERGDPRGKRRTSIVLTVEILASEAAHARPGDDASEVLRVPLRSTNLSEMAFDHGKGIRLLQKKYGQEPESL